MCLESHLNNFYFQIYKRYLKCFLIQNFLNNPAHEGMCRFLKLLHVKRSHISRPLNLPPRRRPTGKWYNYLGESIFSRRLRRPSRGWRWALFGLSTSSSTPPNHQENSRLTIATRLDTWINMDTDTAVRGTRIMIESSAIDHSIQL